MSSWLEHSTTPILATFSSERARSEKGNVEKRLFTSEKKARDVFIFRWYV